MMTKSSKKPYLKDIGIIANMGPAVDGPGLRIIARENLQQKATDGEDSCRVDPKKKEPHNISMTITKECIQDWINEGKMDPEMGGTLINIFNSHENIIKLTRNPNTPRELVAEALASRYNNTENIAKEAEAMRHLISIKDLLEIRNNTNKMSPLFKQNVDQENAFGVTKAIMDHLQYLPELLQNAAMISPNDGSKTYAIRSTISNELEADIGLEHTFQAPDKATARKIAEHYIEDMRSGAIKTFLAYWSYANRAGAFLFAANLADIIETQSEGRSSYTETGAKERFWYQSKLLEDTKLTITIKRNEEKITIKHRLIEIAAVSRGKDGKKGNYPLKIQVQVLDPDTFQKAANLATEISKGTMKLRSEDIMLALTLQIRGAQRRDVGSSDYDEQYLMKRANLQKTFRTNPRIGKKRLKEKLERIEKANVVDGWQAEGEKYSITYRKPKEKLRSVK